LTEYLTEQEQIQQLKTWLKQYGPTVIAGIILAALFSFGWRLWQHHRNNVIIHASAIYDQMLSARAQNNAGESVIQAKKLLSRYANTPYAEMAALMLAREAVLNKNYDEAISQLNWVVDHAHTKAIRQIARIREARIFIAQQKPAEAIKLLKNVSDKAFSGLIDEVKGDAFLAMNDKASARKSYEQALAELPNAEVIRPILQLKYENLTTRESKVTV